ncbi:hypothetical protein [Pedobacter rhizosphaerae]|uniref:DUF4468 domain-containing protein n=1 Tax=Pedobacter rhizosphaerae TaxID=390241 RepID=A0A1H9Q4L9_9SPHI|nr:hypothetical protein [Pedobacter rhizosphaerae]SER55407.1 hypothetical protein SAMN04488023_11132 [Pedobacter rhizosphaerae]
MKIKLIVILFCVVSFKCFAQSKEETIKTINQLLAKAVGEKDCAIINGTKMEFKLTKNSFSVDDSKNYGFFKVAKNYGNPNKEEITSTTVISDWKGFKIIPDKNSTSLSTIYPIIEIKKNEFSTHNSLKYYCLSGDEEKLVAALNHLNKLYSKIK